MKASVLSLFAVVAAVSAHKTISTRYETAVYTVTSCEPTVTDCAVGHETSTVNTYTTECDETDASYPTEAPYPTGAPEQSTVYETDVETITSCPPEVTDCPASHKPTSTQEQQYTTSTVYETKEYTITSCAPTVTNCPVGHVTTTVIASTTVCPVSSHVAPPAYTSTPAGETQPSYPPVETSTIADTTKPAATSPAGPVYSTQTISTCVPTVITSVITVTAAPTKPVEVPTTAAPVCPGGAYCPPVTTVQTSYGTAAPTTGYPIPPKNGTVPFTGSANTQRAGGLLLAVAGVAAALL